MILRFSKEQTPVAREDKFREFCDLTSQALGINFENAKEKDVAGPGDLIMVGTHVDLEQDLDLDGEEPIRIENVECIYIPRAEADMAELRKDPAWSGRFSPQSMDRAFAGLRLNEFLMKEVTVPESGSAKKRNADQYSFVIKIKGLN